MFLKEVYQFFYYTGIFLVGAHWFGVPFPKLQTFSGILWVIPIDYSVYEKTILCSYYIWYYSINDNIFVFTNSAVKPQKVLFANEPFFRKMVALFFCANITLCIQKKKNPVGFSKNQTSMFKRLVINCVILKYRHAF